MFLDTISALITEALSLVLHLIVIADFNFFESLLRFVHYSDLHNSDPLSTVIAMHCFAFKLTQISSKILIHHTKTISGII